MDWRSACAEAAEKIRNSSDLLITAGAGMGVDSGLPDFRGTEGFWKAYPPLAKLGLSFSDAANPKWFFKNPHLAWGFYGHRYQLYSATTPHTGFGILKKWCLQKNDYFVFTSNVDGHFQKAGFAENRIVECHGSINHWQCSVGCTNQIGDMSDFNVGVDESTFLANDPLPACPNCGDLARPNILMFGDYQWVEDRTQEQIMNYNQWLRGTNANELVVIELGAGTAVPTVRWESESQQATLVRINPREPEVSGNGISIPVGAIKALEEIDRVI